MSTPAVSPVAATEQERRREQRAWYFYDWANSAYVTTTATVLFVPYLSSVARAAACPDVPADEVCTTDLSVLGLPVAAGSLALYVVTASTLLSALLLPVVGAIADRSPRPKHLLAGFAWVGSLAAASMFLVTGTNWQLGAALQFVANICLGASLVVYDAILVQIATPDERDRVSSRGWALGYLGGGLLLAVNLALVTMGGSLGLDAGQTVRISLLSAGIWWGVFTLIPFLGLRNRPPVRLAPVERGNLVTESFGQLWQTLKHLRGYPQTLLFLAAYLFFNDGIQTVIGSSSLYGQAELGFNESQLIITILLVQFVAFGGALLFGRMAARIGAKRSVLYGIVMWTGVVAVGFVLPEGQFALFLALAVGIGLVLGGTQALSRSLYSQLVPLGRQAEYFSLYQAAERGTSWFGTFLFGLMFQLTDSYRPAILSLLVFFVVGGLLLVKVDVRKGIADAGNVQPRKV
ncbi:MFS transporter [Quadrisphaera sp. GCM10027208]|uniref:MFS transporter n=1 Tax=Quadrisphaera sp. GCM10027208 TaxID=3273423 RepID=UPI00360DD865